MRTRKPQLTNPRLLPLSLGKRQSFRNVALLFALFALAATHHPLSAAPPLKAEAEPTSEATRSDENNVRPATEETEAIRQAREALGRGRKYPWYDKTTDRIKRIKLPVEDNPSPASSKTTVAPTDGLQVLAWVIIAVVLAGLVAVLIWAFLRKENLAADAARAPTDTLTDVDRVEALPFMAQRSPSDLLGQARAHYEAGNYREAIIYLFSHELVELDKQGLVRLAKGKTNRQYLREVTAIDELRSILGRTMVAFEDVFFGNHELSRAAFEACWQELSVFERRMLEAVA